MIRVSDLLGALTMLVGCDKVLGLDRESPDCGTGVTVLDLDFEDDDVEACEPWGDSFSADGTTVTQRGGVLQVAPRGTGAAGCVSMDSFRFPRGGVIAEVKQVVSTAGAYTSLNVGWEDSIQMKAGELAYEAGDSQPRYAAVPYDATTMRWWRLHDDAGTWTASYSDDGLANWVVFGQRPAPDTQPVTVAVLAGLFMEMPDTTGVAHYGRLLVCD